MFVMVPILSHDSERLTIFPQSAGAHLSLLVVIHFLKTNLSFALSGLLLHFGCFDLSFLPAARNYPKTLIISPLIMQKFSEAFLPTVSTEEVKHPSISPYYEDLEPFRGRLPPALLTCGTDDMLLDDSVAMGMKWPTAGGEAVVKIYPGAAHGFLIFPVESCKEAGMVIEDTVTFIEDCLARS
jgi:acetyl esterase/lipase